MKIEMKQTLTTFVFFFFLSSTALVAEAGAHGSELKRLKVTVTKMQETIDQLNQKVDQLEKATGTTSVPATPAMTEAEPVPPDEMTKQQPTQPPETTETQQTEPPPTAETQQMKRPERHESPITPRDTFNDQQVGAPRPYDLTLDPKYRGFIRVPHTPVMIKFNAQPRVDFTYDSRNPGDNDRFVTAEIPVKGDPNWGGGVRFNVNGKGSRLIIDARAPNVKGDPRFYLENDFFGAGASDFNYHIRHLYGEFFNLVVGRTYSVFEDPDVWPDTVDYEGTNAVVCGRWPLLRYQLPLNDEWQLNFGIEKPDSQVDTSIDATAQSDNHAPDGGFNVRWEKDDVGHIQLAAIFRDIGVNGTVVGKQSVFGWGLNIAASFDLFKHDSIQLQAAYGRGIFRIINDNFSNNDAAFNASGKLKALPVLSAMMGYTHKWSRKFRSSVSYGFVNVDNQTLQDASAYHRTHYASANLILRILKRLSIGVEGLYGYKEVKSHASGDVFRVLGAVMYSIFD